MNWRTAFGACVAILFPLPLVLILAGVLRMGLPEQERVYGRRVAPVLEGDERLRLQSYHRDCRSPSDCEAPLGCLLDARAGTSYCTDSQCLTDVQCQDGQVCRPLVTYGNGPVVRICVPPGRRKEGEDCVRIGRAPEDVCGPGLACAGEDGVCARPCGDDEPRCSADFFCADTELGSMCLPTCEEKGCPEGQHCIRYSQGTSICEKVYGINCQETSCPENQKCEQDHDTSHPATVWMQCVQYCRKDPASCPAGLICDGWACHPPCNPDGPNTCAEGYRCKKARPTRPWVCLPDW